MNTLQVLKIQGQSRTFGLVSKKYCSYFYSQLSDIATDTSWSAVTISFNDRYLSSPCPVVLLKLWHHTELRHRETKCLAQGYGWSQCYSQNTSIPSPLLSFKASKAPQQFRSVFAALLSCFSGCSVRVKLPPQNVSFDPHIWVLRFSKPRSHDGESMV